MMRNFRDSLVKNAVFMRPWCTKIEKVPRSIFLFLLATALFLETIPLKQRTNILINKHLKFSQY